MTIDRAPLDDPADPRLVAGEPRLRPGRAGPGHDLGRARPGDGRQGDAPPRPLAQAAGDPRAHGAGRAVAIAVHGITLLGDPWLNPGVAGVTVPFTMGFRPLFTGLGIVGGYLAALLGLSFYFRKRIGAKLWRKAHRATILVYLLGLGHALRRRHRRLDGLVPVVGGDDGAGDRRALRLPRASRAAPSAAARGGGPRTRGRTRPPSACPPPISAAARSPEPRSWRRHDERRRSCDRRRRPRGAALRRDAAPARLRGAVRIVCAEPEPPYDRPPLSKELLAGDGRARRRSPTARPGGTRRRGSSCCSAAAPRRSTRRRGRSEARLRRRRWLTRSC